MAPIHTAKKGGKRTAKPQKHTVGGREKSQALSGATADAITEEPEIEDASSELAKLMGSAPS